MSKIWEIVRGYILWSYERGSLHYDVMVTLILAFIFLAPLWVNFKDKPTERTPHQCGVVIIAEGESGLFIYQMDGNMVSVRTVCPVGGNDPAIRAALLRVIEPIAGEADLVRYQGVCDKNGRVLSYKAWVRR